MSAKKLVIRVVLFLGPLVLSLVALEIYSRGREKNVINTKLNLINDYADVTRHVIIGNSHARNAFNPEKMDEFSLNLAIGGTSLFHSLDILNKFFDQVDSNSCSNVIIEVSYQSLYKNFNDSLFYDRAYEFKHYLGTEYCVNKDDKLKHNSLLGTIGVPSALKNLGKDIRSSKNLLYDSYGQKKVRKVLDSTRMKESAADRIQFHHEFMTEDSSLLNENMAYLDMIYRLTSENDASLVIVTIPVRNEYLDLQKDTYKLFRKYLKDFCLDKGCTYLDYSYDHRFDDISLFADPDHLNYKGADLFTKVFIKDILRNQRMKEDNEQTGQKQ